MASGVEVSEACKNSFIDMKLGHKYRYIIYGLTDDFKQIVVLKTAQPSATYSDFIQELKAAEVNGQCRYAVFDVEYQSSDGHVRNKIVFFMWNPENAKIRQRMVYSSSKDALKKALGEGIAKEVQANEYSDLNWSNIMDAIMRTNRN